MNRKTIKNALTVLNVFVHDFVSALWLTTLLAVYWTNKTVFPSGMEDFFFRFKREFFFIGLGSLVVILATGIVRTVTYTTGTDDRAFEDTRKKMLIGKHILGFVVYGLGTYCQYKMVYG